MSLPLPGTPAFEKLIRDTTSRERRRQPSSRPDDDVPADVREERRLADDFLSAHNRLLTELTRRTQ